MKAYLQLTASQLRIFARNRQVLFWTLFFPIFLMTMLGSFLGGGQPISVDVQLIDLDRTAASQAFVTAMQSPDLPLHTALDENLDHALAELKRGNIQLVAVIAKGYESSLAPGRSKPAEPQITVYYDDTNLTVSQVGLPLMGQVVDGISKKVTHYEPAVTMQTKGMESLHLKYIDFLVPGIVAMMIMSNNLNGVAGQIASWRERGILRRMQSTPLRASSFIAAQITARLILNGLQAVIVLLVGSLIFGTQVNGSWLLLLLFVIIGTLAFMSIGFIIAGLAKTPESVGPIAGFLSFPMMFLGGVFFPIKNMPDFLQPLVKLLPITHLSTALRQVMNVGAGLQELWPELAILGGWTVVAFLITSYTFKWE
jgi:ABC-2 type transport system permease protein